jgi:hypothetical protein
MQTQKLLKLVREDCKANNIRFFLGRGHYLRLGKMKCNGYFDNAIATLAVASKLPNFPLILVHEYSHMQQWKEDCKEWQAYNNCIHGPLWEFDITPTPSLQKNRDHAADVTMWLERDCEIRSLELLLAYKYKYPETYIQKANAYTIFYLFVAKHSKWYKIGKEPYNLKSVYSKFPTTFDIDPYEVFKECEQYYWACV